MYIGILWVPYVLLCTSGSDLDSRTILCFLFFFVSFRFVQFSKMLSTDKVIMFDNDESIWIEYYVNGEEQKRPLPTMPTKYIQYVRDIDSLTLTLAHTIQNTHADECVFHLCNDEDIGWRASAFVWPSMLKMSKEKRWQKFRREGRETGGKGGGGWWMRKWENS